MPWERGEGKFADPQAKEDAKVGVETKRRAIDWVTKGLDGHTSLPDEIFVGEAALARAADVSDLSSENRPGLPAVAALLIEENVAVFVAVVQEKDVKVGVCRVDALAQVATVAGALKHLILERLERFLGLLFRESQTLRGQERGGEEQRGEHNDGKGKAG